MSTKSAHVLRKINSLNPLRENVKYVVNRNPRNLEKMCIAYKPDGFHLERAGRKFWNKLEIEVSNKYVTAKIVHHENGTILEASTKEWAIKKQLYRTTDTAAFTNLAQVLAQRCQEMGLTQVESFIEVREGGKIHKFLQTLEASGVKLKEPERYMPARPWDQLRPDKPWDVLDDK